MIIWLKGAQKDLQKLPREAVRRILDAMDLYHDERIGDVKKLKGKHAGHYRLRVGDWRVIFRFEGRDIVVVSVSHRRDAYR